MIEAALVALLRRTASVVALVGDRIHPGRLPQGSTLPALVYTRISSTAAATHRGRTRPERVRFQLDAWACTYDDAHMLAEACKSLSEFRGVVEGREIVVEFDTDRDLDEPELDLRRVAMDFFVWG